jgi:hypothetical protein
MIKHCVYVIVAMGSLSLNSAFGHFTGVTLEENDTGRTGRETLSNPAVIKTPGSQLPPPGGNPLWGIPIRALTATRERPIFSASRRPPAPPAAAEPVAEAPPPPPAEPERPLFTLVGTVTGEPQNVAVVQDQTTKSLVRLHVGEAVSGWFLRSIDARRVTVEKNSQTVTVALPAPSSAPVGPLAMSEDFQAGQQS